MEAKRRTHSLTVLGGGGFCMTLSRKPHCLFGQGSLVCLKETADNVHSGLSYGSCQSYDA